jgi:hypothetical protein
MNPSWVKDLGKIMNKLIIHILFLVALKLNIVNIILKKQDAIHVGR